MADLIAVTVMVIAAGVIIVVATIVAQRRNEQHGAPKNASTETP
jgi:hypothetical protein